MDTLGDKKLQKKCEGYYCKICDYSTSRKSSYDKHLTTALHKSNTIDDEKDTKSCKKLQESCTTFSCENCGKEYKHRQGLWKHKKKCHDEPSQEKDTSNTPNKEEVYGIVKYLMAENCELKTMMIEQQTKMIEQQNMVLEIAKNGTTANSHNTNNANNTNSHNKTFNLQFFLNETCKNAMNIEDFVNDIVLTLKDLEDTGRLGFSEGISKMITSKLKALDVTERPFHCSDLKRESLYVKEENKWEKEEETKPKLTKAIKNIAGKNMMQIFDWQKAHPDYNDPDTRTSDKYMKMLTNVMSGGTEEETNSNYDKIIRNLIKEATINKERFSV
jgi:hypothetical protein